MGQDTAFRYPRTLARSTQESIGNLGSMSRAPDETCSVLLVLLAREAALNRVLEHAKLLEMTVPRKMTPGPVAKKPQLRETFA